ncbi:MAG: rRNA maturation RNase YbeY [Bacteroidota bacterium]
MSRKISFFCEKIKFNLKNREKLRDWIITVAAAHEWKVGEVTYVFCDDEYLLDINIRYLKHDTLTDIITFPLQDEPQIIKGEIYISIPRVFENAENFGIETETELHRVMVHGILHLMGFKDKSKEQKVHMRQLEDDSLMILQQILSGTIE